MQRIPNQHVQHDDVVGEKLPADNGELPAEEVRRVEEEDVFYDAEEVNDFQAAPSNTDINCDEMAENYFARADKIHQ
jgi:hypothetical protein